MIQPDQFKKIYNLMNKIHKRQNKNKPTRKMERRLLSELSFLNIDPLSINLNWTVLN